jgi:SAM-dependent methyltransferase
MARIPLTLALPAALMLSCAPRHAHGPEDHQGHRSAHRHHRFQDAEHWAKRFEDPARDAWQRPEAVLDLLRLPADARVADIGSATGYFTVRLARRVPQGKVWGLDVEPDMVRYLNARATREGLAHLRSVLTPAGRIQLPEPVDLVFICNTYHHVEGRDGYFRSLSRQLRPGGRLAVVDFKLGPIPVGPPEAQRVGPDQLDRELRAAGWQRVLLDTTTLPHQYVAVYAPGL